MNTWGKTRMVVFCGQYCGPNSPFKTLPALLPCLTMPGKLHGASMNTASIGHGFAALVGSQVAGSFSRRNHG